NEYIKRMENDSVVKQYIIPLDVYRKFFNNYVKGVYEYELRMGPVCTSPNDGTASVNIFISLCISLADTLDLKLLSNLESIMLRANTFFLSVTKIFRKVLARSDSNISEDK
ncbi:unnamed protein product, partial [Leptidea sinapis]